MPNNYLYDGNFDVAVYLTVMVYIGLMALGCVLGVLALVWSKKHDK